MRVRPQPDLGAGAPEVCALVDGLIDAWCERRALGPLGFVLRAYPMPSGLGDSWGELPLAPQDVRALARYSQTDRELDRLDEAIAIVGRILRR